MPGKTGCERFSSRKVMFASMRPQRNAGENGLRRVHHFGVDIASMRPQRNAGENKGRGVSRGLSRAVLQ